MAGAIGLAIIFVFMCFVYLIPGLAAGLALPDLHRTDPGAFKCI